MHISTYSLLIFTIFFSNINAHRTPPLAANPKYSLGVTVGYTHNFGVNVYGAVSDFSYDIPLTIKLSAG